ncbi:MAG: hypothetical protein NT075_32785 [Chloroflexi bacterium]|nr:hypothetical protein [Chloroflexota bacterium]
MQYHAPAFAFRWSRLGYILIISLFALFLFPLVVSSHVYGDAPPDLVIHKTTNVTTVSPGDTIVYTLDYTNTSAADALGVIITEYIPANTQYIAGDNTDSWDCGLTPTPGTACILLIGSVATGTSGSVNFAVKVDKPAPVNVAEISNTAYIGDLISVDADSDTLIIPLVAAPDLSVKKKANVTSVVPGGSIIYTLHYANSGNQDAANVTLQENLPANTTFTGDTSYWSCAPDKNANIVCAHTFTNLAAGASGDASFVVTVGDPAPAGVASIANTASIGDDGVNGDDPTPSNNSDLATVALTAVPDLVLSKSDGGVTSTPGGTIVYSLNYTNTGRQDATGVVLVETVPNNTQFNASASSSNWACSPNTNATSTCHLAIGALASGGHGTALFAVTVVNPVLAGVTQIVNTASVNDDHSNGDDPTPSNNSAGDTTPLTAAPDLVLSKSDGGATGVPGGTIVYTLSYTNTGNQDATGVVLVETVPDNTQFNASASSPNWICSPNTNAPSTCRLAIGALAGGGHGTALFAVTVVNPVPVGIIQIANTASVNDDHSNGADPTLGNNSASDTTPVVAAPKLSLDKRHDVSFAQPGKSIIYTVVYTNAGNQDVAGVVLTETIPANTKFNTNSSTTGWTCVPNSGVATSICKFTIGNVAGGAHGNVNFAVTVVNSLPSGVTQISNTVFIGDNRTANVASDTDITPVRAAAGLVILKTDGGITVKPGDTLVYTLNYTNTGNQTAAGVMITETVPAHTSFVGNATVWDCSSTLAGGICKHASGDLAGSVSGSLTFAVKLDNPLPAGVVQIDNSVKIGHSAAANVDESSTATPVNAAPDLSLTKNDSNVKVKPGENIVYTLGYTNHGNQDATGVVIQETVPEHTSFVATASSPGWTCTGPACSYVVGNLAAGATGTVIFAINVNSALPLGVGQVTNSATIHDDASNGSDLSLVDNTATDTTQLSVSYALNATKQATLIVDADGNQAASPGDTLEYLVTLNNSGNNSLNNVDFQDLLDTNTQLVTNNSIQTSQGNVVSGNNVADQTVQVAVGVMASGADVQIRFQVKIKSPLSASISKIVNQGVVKSSELPDVLTDDPAVVGNSDATRTLLSTPVALRVTLIDYLFTDADDDDKVSGGDTLLYRLTVFNVGNAGVNDLIIDDVPGVQSALMAGTVRTDQGEYVTGNATGDTHLQIHIAAELASGGRATISFQVKVNNNVTTNQIVNQAQVTVKQGANSIIVLSDDPDTGPSGDATVTPVGARLPSPDGGKLFLPVISKR